MLAENLLGGPAVVIMLAREVEDLIPGPFDPRGAVRVKAQMREMKGRAHGVDRSMHLPIEEKNINPTDPKH